MSRFTAAPFSFAAGAALAVLMAAAPALAGSASGTIGRKTTTLKVADAVAYKSTGSFGDDQVIKLVLASSAFDAKALAAAIDIDREVSRQLEGKGDSATLEFGLDGAWHGGGSYWFRENGCGFCQNGAQQAQLAVAGGVLKGTLKARSSDTDDNDGVNADLTVNAPILEVTGVTKLAAGGGEPGKALVACQKTLKGTDKAAFVASCFAADDPDVVDKNIDYFETVGELANAFSYGRRGIFLEDLKITGGRMKGDQAELTVEGKQVYRAEGEPESTENYKGRIFLVRGASGWRYAGDELEQDY